MKQTIGTFLVFLVLVCSNYSGPEPLRSPLELPLHGVAGISALSEVDDLRANAWYQWSLEHGLADDRFVPEIRDASQWWDLYSGEVVITPTLLLGFNEPDLCPDQACLTPIEALGMEHWRLEYYTSTLHVSPAPSQNNIYWLSDLRDLYIDVYDEPPDWTYLAAHCYFYDSTTMMQCKTILSQYIAWANEWGASGVLITEFAAGALRYSPSQPFDYSTAAQLEGEFMVWAARYPEIVGWFHFSAHDWPGVWPWNVSTALYDSNGITLLGEMYKEQAW